MKTVKIMVVAGEASGDAHAARLVRAMRQSAPDVRFEFFGSAGPEMRDEGVEPIVHADELAIMGLSEIARSLPIFLSAFQKLRHEAASRRPDAVILVDFPEFNLKLARSLKKKGLKVIYYISPQLWGWRQYRRRTIERDVDLLLSILPFEKDWYAARGITNVEYVGNPLTNEVRATMEREEFCAAHGLDPNRPVIALLPGSRRKELVHILPDMIRAASMMPENGSIQFVTALASTRRANEVDSVVSDLRVQGVAVPESFITVKDQTYNVLEAADAAAVASGTATLEAGIIGTPMAIVYKTSVLNYGLLRPLIDVEFFGLVNLIAGEAVARELIQGDLTADNLAAELWRLLDPKVNAEVREQLRRAADKLGHGGASRRAAEAILRLLEDDHRPLQPPLGGICS